MPEVEPWASASSLLPHMAASVTNDMFCFALRRWPNWAGRPINRIAEEHARRRDLRPFRPTIVPCARMCTSRAPVNYSSDQGHFVVASGLMSYQTRRHPRNRS